jgi:hypothetical protein
MEATTVISQYELERGKPVPRFKHGIVQGNLIVALAAYREKYSIVPEIDIDRTYARAKLSLGFLSCCLR